MKDKMIFLLVPLILLLVIVMSVIMYDNYETRRINEKLKKEKFQCKQELKKLKKEELGRIVNK